MIIHYDSPAAMARFASESCTGQDAWTRTEYHFLGVDGQGIKTMLANGGDESDVPAARKLLDKFETELPETDRAEFLPSIAGAYPCVPDFILGLPESMRAKSFVTNTGAPIKIGVVTTVSASIDQEAFRCKAAAMLAILMHLQNSGRPVELYGISTMHGTQGGETVLAYRINAAPLSLSEANMALGNLAFARRIPFAIGEKVNGFDGRWPTDFDEYDNGKNYSAKLAKRMGFQMILPALHINEARDIKANPAKWMMDKYNAIQAQLDSDA